MLREGSMAEAETNGRVTLPHLLVEHHLREYDEKRIPYLGNTERINFLGLVELADGPDTLWLRVFLIPGLLALHAIRNRLSHDLDPQKVKAVDVDTLRSFNVRMEKAGLPLSAGQSLPEIVQRFGTWAIITLKLERLVH